MVIYSITTRKKGDYYTKGADIESGGVTWVSLPTSVPCNDYGQPQRIYSNKSRATKYSVLLGIKVCVTLLAKQPKPANMLDRGEGNLEWRVG